MNGNEGDGGGILILTTGGTIDKQYFDALSEFQVTDSLVAQELEIARVTYPFRIEEILRKDSLDLSESDRRLIAAAVATAPESRVIVTHGTDTMTDTAKALSHIVKTIVLVGALTPARFTESDASFNLGMAFAVAQTAMAGVYITMNGSVFDANLVRKDRGKNAFVTTS